MPSAWDRYLEEVRPGGSLADGDGYSDYDGLAVTSSRHRAPSPVTYQGPGAALDSAPPANHPNEPPGTDGAKLDKGSLEPAGYARVRPQTQETTWSIPLSTIPV